MTTTKKRLSVCAREKDGLEVTVGFNGFHPRRRSGERDDDGDEETRTVKTRRASLSTLVFVFL